MKKIKQMLIEKANKQEIHDLQNEILKNVDMNKVRTIELPSKKHSRRFVLSNVLLASTFAATCVLIGIGIGSMGKTTGTETETKTFEQNGQRTYNDDLYINDEAAFQIYLNNVFNRECYNMINIAPALKNLSVINVTPAGEDKKMTESEENCFVNDLHSEIYNIEGILGLKDKENCTVVANTNPNYDYDYVISVNNSYSNYYIYYNEFVYETKYANGKEYKTNSNIEGLIVSGTDEYEFHGNRNFKSSTTNDNFTTTYSNYIEYNGYNILVKEVFQRDKTELSYTFYNNDTKIKKIEMIEKYEKESLQLQEIEFDTVIYNNDGTELDKLEAVISSKHQSDANYIFLDISSRNGDKLTINKNNDQFSYYFKNSKNTYVK